MLIALWIAQQIAFLFSAGEKHTAIAEYQRLFKQFFLSRIGCLCAALTFRRRTFARWLNERGRDSGRLQLMIVNRCDKQCAARERGSAVAQAIDRERIRQL